MAVNIGPKIGIDGEAQFRKELNNIIQQAKTLDSEMKAVTSSFDKNADGQEKLEAQAKVLNSQLQVQEKRVGLLEEGLQQAAKKFGEGATETLKWEQALNEAKSTLNGMKSNLSGLENGVEDVTEELEEGEKASFGFGDALKAGLLSHAIIDGVKNLAGKISDLTESTKEYRKIMASLEVSSKRAGYSAEETAEVYKTLYGVLGDEQTAATTTANLQAIGLEQDKLTELTNAAVGAWATYGDSIPIDGLAESVNETIKAGQVTGTFADVLNWASLEGETFGVKLKKNTKANEEWNKAVEAAETAEDYFNLALQDANNSTERANIVLKMLSKQGLPKAGKAWQEANGDIVEANQASSDFQDITAGLAKKFSPISIGVQKGFNKIARAASDMVDDSDIDKFTDMIEDMTDFIAEDVVPVVKDIFDFIIDNKDYVIEAVKGIGTGFAAWKGAEVVSKVSGYFKELTTNAGNAATPMGILNGLWQANPAAVVGVSVGLLTTALGFLHEAVTAQTEEQKLLQEQYEKSKEAIDGLAESYDNTKEAAYNAAGAEIEQLDSVKLLYDELTTLADETGKVTDKDRDRAEFILSRLNEALGTEYEMTGNQIQRYGELKKSIEELVQTKKAEALINAQEKVYTDAVSKRQEAQKNFVEAYGIYQTEKERIDREYLDKYKKSLAEQGVAEEDRQGMAEIMLQHFVSGAYEHLQELEFNWQNAAAQIGKYDQDIQLYNQATEEMFKGNTQGVVEMLENQSKAYLNTTDLVGKSAEEQKAILKDQYDKSLDNLLAYKAEFSKGTAGYTKEGLAIVEQYSRDCRSAMEQAGKNASQGFADGAQANKGAVTAAARSIGDAFVGIFKKNLKIHSPSQVMMGLGEYTGEGFEIGVENSMEAALASLNRQLSAGVSDLSSLTPFSVPVGFGNPAFPASSSGRSVSYGDFNIVVNAAPGMDTNALAEMVGYKLQTQIMQREAAFR